jgi:hypothetical protein
MALGSAVVLVTRLSVTPVLGRIAVGVIWHDIVLVGLLVYRIDRCCGDVEGSDSEEDEPPSGMFS